MGSPAYPWMDRTDPNEFGANFERGFRHYRAEYIRLMDILTSDKRPTNRDELDMMRREKDHAAARALGFSQHLI